jgi:hypothetical protein
MDIAAQLLQFVLVGNDIKQFHADRLDGCRVNVNVSGIYQVSTSYQPCLPTQVMFHIEDYVQCCFLVLVNDLVVRILKLKTFDANEVAHFQFDCVCPESVSVLLVKLQCMTDRTWHFNAILENRDTVVVFLFLSTFLCATHTSDCIIVIEIKVVQSSDSPNGSLQVAESMLGPLESTVTSL